MQIKNPATLNIATLKKKKDFDFFVFIYVFMSIFPTAFIHLNEFTKIFNCSLGNHPKMMEPSRGSRKRDRGILVVMCYTLHELHAL